jgi:deazaflavin-dependent oxidoreductase (nitroreductase family)
MDRSRSGWKNEPRPNPLQKQVHRLLMLKPVSKILSKVLHRSDLVLLRLTGGRHTFAELAGLPVARLTMKGAKTGKMRTLPLVSIPAGDRFVLIATNFGQQHQPAWYYNLKAHPECEVTYQGRSQMFIARETAGEEYKRFWELALTYYAGYEKYRERAAPRWIPVMVLEPKR